MRKLLGISEHAAAKVGNMQPFSTTAVSARAGRKRFRSVGTLVATLKVAASVAWTVASMNVNNDGKVVGFGIPTAVPACLAGESEKYEMIPMRGDEFWRVFTPEGHYDKIESLDVGQAHLAHFLVDAVIGTHCTWVFHGTSVLNCVQMIKNSQVSVDKVQIPMRETRRLDDPDGIFVTPLVGLALGSYSPSLQGMKLALVFSVNESYKLPCGTGDNHRNI